MNNPFRKKTHELTEIERMKDRMRQIQNLENQVKDLKQVLAMERRHRDVFSAKANAYDWLREQELMLMTTDGVKYLKGEDLDAYVDAHRTPIQESWINHASMQMEKAIDTGVLRAWVDEAETHATDAFTYTTNGRVLYGYDTGKES